MKEFDEMMRKCVEERKRGEGKWVREMRVRVWGMKGEMMVGEKGGMGVVKDGVRKEWVGEMLLGCVYGGWKLKEEEEE